jgi:phosphatidylserine/phosphatidylglycerophosphate/cardiolipin synthase-like enzyme/membrane protein DedA with SNARE-associated domain
MTILKEGHNCWRISHADRAALLIDGAAYFEALADTVEKAQKTILIAAWDIDSRIRLLRPNDAGNPQPSLGDFLNASVKQTRGLHAYVLAWDFPVLYLREREWLPVFNLGWKTHRRIHFHLDDEHPIGASQHQKFVVIDDQLAFCGGIDLTNSRWDTPQHHPDDSRRKNPDDKSYGPFHDIQMVVSGEIAAALAELFRDRWKWATGDRIEGGKGESADLWPKNLTPDLENVQIAIARTLPSYKEREQIREVEKLYTDGIAAAQQSIYIESQYLTSDRIGEAIAHRLTQKQGPEIVVVLPKNSSGWLEQSTMDALRARILKQLFKADRHQRLRVFYPALKNSKNTVYVHSKLMVVDDRLAIVGSANLSNRSMGLDSECCLAIEADRTTPAAKAIETMRHRLLSEHMGAPIDSVSKAIADRRSIIKAIEFLSASSERRLDKLDHKQAQSVDAAAIVEDHKLLDPETPVEFDRMMDRFVQDTDGRAKIQQVIKVAGVLLILLALAAAWRWTPLSEWINQENLAAWARAIRDHPLAFPGVLGAYVIGGLIMIPVTLLVGVTVMVFSPLWGALYALSGCLLNAWVIYLIGSRLGKQTIRKLAGQRLNRLSRQIAKQGILTVAVIRNIPVAPYTIVNMIAGASHIRLKDYLIGTAIGMLPGILAITLFADRLLHAIQNPNWINAFIAALLAIAFIGGSWWTKKRLTGRRGNTD